MKKAEINVEVPEEKKEEVIEEVVEKDTKEVKKENKKADKYKVLMPCFYNKRYEVGEITNFTAKEAQELMEDGFIEEV